MPSTERDDTFQTSRPSGSRTRSKFTSAKPPGVSIRASRSRFGGSPSVRSPSGLVLSLLKSVAVCRTSTNHSCRASRALRRLLVRRESGQIEILCGNGKVAALRGGEECLNTRTWSAPAQRIVRHRNRRRDGESRVRCCWRGRRGHFPGSRRGGGGFACEDEHHDRVEEQACNSAATNSSGIYCVQGCSHLAGASCGSARHRLSSVVVPAPRKPVTGMVGLLANFVLCMSEYIRTAIVAAEGWSLLNSPLGRPRWAILISGPFQKLPQRESQRHCEHGAVDFDRQDPDESQSALLVGKDANNMGSALNLLAEHLKSGSCRSLSKTFVMFPGSR